MQEEEFTPEFYHYFYNEELFQIPEAAATALPLPIVQGQQPKEAAAQEPEPEPLPFELSGQNMKRVAVIVNLFEADFAKIRQQQMLMRLLAAIKLSPDDVVFVNLTGAVTDLEPIRQATGYEQAVLFLAPNHKLVKNLRLKPFQPMAVNGKYVIAGAELSALQGNEEQKRQLWTGLQAMFL